MQARHGNSPSPPALAAEPILGAHMSIAGGYHKAVQRAAQAGCRCLQLFTQNNNQWRDRSVTPDEAAQFQTALSAHGIQHPIAHDSYLINLAAPGKRLWRRSIEAFVHEMQRAELLGIPYLVTHPGCYTTSSPARGIRRIVAALDEIHAQTPDTPVRCLLETTAGQGTSLGWRFEHLAEILAGVAEPDRLGICFDTCHVFAAGYPLGTPEDYQATMAALDRLVGLERIKAFHLNDSRRGLGSRVDRHDHIGRGQMGREPFRLLLRDPRFRAVPMYLETPKGEEDGVDLDRINLALLRELAGG
jgi:deoxyribonuclease-4